MAAITQPFQPRSKHNTKVATRRQLRRKNAKSTPGKDKCESCQASSQDRFMAGYSKSHRNKNAYAAWCKKKKG